MTVLDGYDRFEWPLYSEESLLWFGSKSHETFSEGLIVTNVEGLWMLFVLLFLLGASLAVFILRIGVFGWMRWASRELGN